jgi:hypothetical protein
MGMYDSVTARCPQCDLLVEFQSKAGDCTLTNYRLTRVPPEIAKDLNGEMVACSCGYVLKLTNPNTPFRVKMQLTGET